MSASLLVDLGGTCQLSQSLPGTFGGTTTGASGQFAGLSGTFIGQSIDMINANTYCNLIVMGQSVQSGSVPVVQVQTSDSDTSGTYTDPMSGFTTFPTAFSSGGLLWIGSGGGNGLLAPQTSGQSILSGFSVAAGFQRPGRFARVNFIGAVTSGFIGQLTAGFVSQLKTTGSGGGFSTSPSSGVVSV